MGRIGGSLRLTIASGRQRARRGVAPPVLGIFSGYDSQPLRAGLNCGAPTALRERPASEGEPYTESQRGTMYRAPTRMGEKSTARNGRATKADPGIEEKSTAKNGRATKADPGVEEKSTVRSDCATKADVRVGRHDV